MNFPTFLVDAKLAQAHLKTMLLPCPVGLKICPNLADGLSYTCILIILLDYHNATYLGIILSDLINPLIVQNTAAQVFVNMKYSDHFFKSSPHNQKENYEVT